jgi:hypothetical protein
MTTTGFEVVGVGIITVAAIMGKVIESGHTFHSARTRGGQRDLISAYYECANFHLHLSLGMLGLAWSRHWDAAVCCPLLILIMAGVGAKGVLAGPKPDTLRFSDSNAFVGLYLPNILAFVCVGFALIGPFLRPLDEGDYSQSSKAGEPNRTFQSLGKSDDRPNGPATPVGPSNSPK